MVLSNVIVDVTILRIFKEAAFLQKYIFYIKKLCKKAVFLQPVNL